MKILSVLLLCSFGISSASYAFIIYPQGQRSALTGNVGIARLNSLDGVIINPGSLGYNSEENSVSLSGGILSAEKLDIEYAGMNNSKQEDLNSAFSGRQIPGLFVSGTSSQHGRFGYFLHSENDIVINKYSNLVYPDSLLNISLEYQMSQISLGGFYALQLENNWQIGLTSKITQWKYRGNSFSKMLSNGSNSVQFRHEVNNGYLLGIKLGATQSINENSSWGFYYSPWSVSETGEGYVIEGMATTAGEFSDESRDYESRFELPSSIGFGFRFQLSKWNILCDLEHKSDYKTFYSHSASDMPESISIGFGSELALSNQKRWLSGIRYSQNYFNKHTESYLLTSGYERPISFLNVLTGGFYSFSQQKAFSEKESYSGGIKASAFGLIFSTSFEY